MVKESFEGHTLARAASQETDEKAAQLTTCAWRHSKKNVKLCYKLIGEHLMRSGYKTYEELANKYSLKRVINNTLSYRPS